MVPRGLLTQGDVPTGVGATPTPLDDIPSQIAIVQVYLTAAIGGTATAAQLTAAQAALNAIAADTMTAKSQLPPGVWISGTAAGAVAAGAGLIGGVVGFIAGGRSKTKKKLKEKTR